MKTSENHKVLLKWCRAIFHDSTITPYIRVKFFLSLKFTCLHACINSFWSFLVMVFYHYIICRSLIFIIHWKSVKDYNMWCVARYGTICTIFKKWKTPKSRNAPHNFNTIYCNLICEETLMTGFILTGIACC